MAEPNVILLGSGEHATVLMGLMRVLGIVPTCIADPGRERGPTDFYNLPCIGNDDAVFDRNPDDVILVNGIGSVSRPRQHRTVFERFHEKGYHFLKLVHPAAVIADSAELGEGVQIMAGCVVQPHAVIGANAIINTRAGIDHHSFIGESTHIAPGVTICGGVRVGTACMIGAGATIIQYVKIGDFSLIGAGATVKGDVGPNSFLLA